MRLELTRKSDLAIRVLRVLGAQRSRVRSAQLAAAVNSTVGFVPQVLNPLVRAGWVDSYPGPTGGYALTADLSTISVLSVIEAIEGPTDTGRCVLVEGPCNEGGHCALHEPWTRARALLLNELDVTSVAEAPVGVGRPS